MAFTRRQIIGGAVAGSGLASWPLLGGSTNPPQMLFREVRLVDGTGAPPRLADVLVEGDRILRVGAPGKLRSLYGARFVPGEGRVLAPGFIDLHAHGDPLDDSYQTFLAMGVTTIVLGQDGDGPRVGDDLDLRSWMRAVDAAAIDLNVAALSSHGTLRRAAGVADSVRRPDAARLARMAAVLEREQQAGAFGMSYGLEYVPGIYSEAAELNNLGRVVALHGGVVMSHMRSEDDDRVNASIDELIASSQPARAHISHLKVVYGKGEARARTLLDYIAAKRRAGIAVTADAYPYAASYTGVALLFPEWALPPTDYAQVVRTRGPELRAYLERRMLRRNGPGALLIGTRPHAGKTVADAAKEAGLAWPDFLMKLGPEGASGAHFIMDQAVVDTIFADPAVAVCTDGGPGMRHPRATGTYARLIQDYVVRDRRLTLEAAVHKATGYPARILRLGDRGVIRAGARADLVLFDPAKVAARSTYLDPFAQAAGFDLVLVNGQVAFADGQRQGRAGRLLRAMHPRGIAARSQGIDSPPPPA